MIRKYNFISGLPRSGSTLLSSILKQNPRFTAGISDPLQMYVHSIIKDTSTAVGMEAAVPVEKRRTIVHGLFDSFYSQDSEVCFNTNRGWSSDTALLADLFPNFKMIVCIREIPWILDSFERLNSKNPFTIKPLYHHQQLANVYERSAMLMGDLANFPGYVQGPLMGVKQCLASDERRHICFVEYDTLVSNPLKTMQQIYQFIEEPWFNHDFNNVEATYDEFDTQAKIQGLHTVRPRIEYSARNSVLPNDLWQKYEAQSFWKYNFNINQPNLNWIKSTAKPAVTVNTKPFRQL